MILQFGTSRFLQAHVDLFAWEAAQAGQDVPDIAIVQVSGDASRAGRLQAFNDSAGFPVIVRGLEQGVPVERRVQVCSVTRGLSASGDWAALCDLFVDRATHIVSNSGDTGYDIGDADRARNGDGPPRSFCGILLNLLHRRWMAGRPGVTLLPCELVAANGATLRKAVRGLAIAQGLETDFIAWLEATCLWVNTLVDRIVSAPLEPAGAVAEPYALWAIERQPALVMPFVHPSVTVVNDLQRSERLKLHILNLGHSWLAEEWAQAGGDRAVTVLSMMQDEASADRLARLYADEVVPGFTAMGWGEHARDYVAMTLDRFANPYLEHRLSDIHAHHPAKVAKRIGAFVDWVDGSDCHLPMPHLRALAGRYGDIE
ncbi:D-mannonate oxidoreductase [Sphingobium sp. CCH11-B1]|jgi:tagaturonate reductase|uniref:mannitol dehydrogenase family protein n=1 Tax=Sphingobium sp. CCH11-B1 TaxID=1768781 RepID=UPI00083149BA|nr:D-mannonate oxidoreductase [Sphingobium sp. CCH11-B1]MEA3389051.1 mannitol dehydrogenase family protein [Pseudomonadota bacterium]